MRIDRELSDTAAAYGPVFRSVKINEMEKERKGKEISTKGTMKKAKEIENR